MLICISILGSYEDEITPRHVQNPPKLTSSTLALLP